MNDLADKIITTLDKLVLDHFDPNNPNRLIDTVYDRRQVVRDLLGRCRCRSGGEGD